jgi:hypothetical protein
MTEEKKQEIRNMPWSKMEVIFEPRGDNGLEGYSLNMDYGFKVFVNDEGKTKYIVTNGLNSEGKAIGDIDVIGRNVFGKYFRPVTNKGEIRKRANKLLDILASELLKNINSDRPEGIIKAMSDIKSSEINWETDVVKSVREKLSLLTTAAEKRLKDKQKMEENTNTQTGRMQELLKSFENKNEIIREVKETIVDESKVLQEAERLKELARVDEWNSNSQFAGTAQFNPGAGQTVNTFLPNFSQNNFKHNPNYTYLQPGEALTLAIKRTLESGAPVKDMGFYEEVNWNLNNMGFDSKLPLDIKNALGKMLKDNA